jgi:starch synthase
MEGPRFGTLPVVRLTGGLRDTVSELEGDSGNGFTFFDYSATELRRTMERAMDFYRRPTEEREPQMKRIMRESFEVHSVARTAEAYVEAYEALIEGTEDEAPATVTEEVAASADEGAGGGAADA